MKESKISSLSSADIAFYEQLADEAEADFNAEVDAMSDRECYEIIEKWRKRDGLPSRTFEEFIGMISK
jgi:hypothetical protein